MKRTVILMFFIFLFLSSVFAQDYHKSESHYFSSNQLFEKFHKLKSTGTTKWEIIETLGYPDEVKAGRFGEDIWHYDSVSIDGYDLGRWSSEARNIKIIFKDDRVIPCNYLKFVLLKALDIIFFPIFLVLNFFPFGKIFLVPIVFFSLVCFFGIDEPKWKFFCGYLAVGSLIYLFINWFYIFVQVGPPK